MNLIGKSIYNSKIYLIMYIRSIFAPASKTSFQSTIKHSFSRRRRPQTHYSILRVEPSASPSQIKSKYIMLVKKYHPDISSLNKEKIKLINQAYRVLSDPQQRKAYDTSMEIEKMKRESTQSRRQQQEHFYQENPRERRQNMWEEPPRHSFMSYLVRMFLMGMAFTTLLIVLQTMISPRQQNRINSQSGFREQRQMQSYNRSNFDQEFQKTLNSSFNTPRRN